MPVERCEPILPSRDLQETRDFYRRLGFCVWFDGAEWPDYEIVSRGDIVMHFFSDKTCTVHDAGCYWRTPDAESLYRECLALALPTTGAPRLSPLENTAWGMREFNLVDPSGNLIRIGQELG